MPGNSINIGGGGGSGFALGPPTNSFATIAARTAYGNDNADWLAAYDANPILYVQVTASGTSRFYRRWAGAWSELDVALVGRDGPKGDPASVNAGNVDPLILAYSGQIPGLTIPVSQIPPEVMLDNEFTAQRVLSLIGVTQVQFNDFFRGAVVTGTGTSRTIVVTQQDGSTITLRVPQAAAAGGGGGGGDPVSNAVFSDNGMSFTLTLDSGATVVANIPAILRNAGLTQSAVQALINAAEADDVSASDVASQISTALATYRTFASVSNKSADYTLVIADRGDTIRLTGGTARTFSAPASPPNGWWVRLLNTSTAVLTFDVGVTGRIEGHGQTVEIPASTSITVQYLGTSVWGIVANTAGEASDGGGSSSEPAELVVLAIGNQVVGSGTGSQTGASGVASQVLPAEYTDYDNTELIVYDPRNNTTTFIYVRNDWLSTQTDGNSPKLGASDQDEAGSRQWITWTPSTRTFGRSGQSANTADRNILRIVGVRLYDDGGAGGSGEIPDNSIAASKALAGTAAEKIAWRDRIGASTISFGNTLPALADVGEIHVRIISQDVADGLSFVDIADRDTVLTSADVGDVIMTIRFRDKTWVRVGNIITGRGDAIARANISALRDNVNSIRLELTALFDGLPDPPFPDNVGTAKQYVLNIPASGSASERATWEEPSREDTTARASAAEAKTLADANTAARWPGEVFVVPHEIPVDQEPFTMRVFLHTVGGSYPAGTKMRINASGRNGAYVTLSSENPAELAFDATQVRNLVSNPSGGLVGGLPRLHIADSSDNELAVISLRIPLIPRGKWRELSGASPYTVLLTDDEFIAWVNHTDDDVNYAIPITRNQLGTASKKFGAAQNQITSQHRWTGVNANLNVAGTELTIALGGQDADQWTFEGVEAR